VGLIALDVNSLSIILVYKKIVLLAITEDEHDPDPELDP
jgi:hypothetical protein